MLTNILKRDPKTAATGIAGLVASAVIVITSFSQHGFGAMSHEETAAAIVALIVGIQGLVGGDSKPALPASQVTGSMEVVMQPSDQVEKQDRKNQA